MLRVQTPRARLRQQTRRRVERAVAQEAAPAVSAKERHLAASEAADPREARAELWRHEVVQDGVDGRVEVVHRAAEVEYVEVLLDAQIEDRLVADEDDPECESPEGQQAEEEQQHDGAEHEHDLPAAPAVALLAAESGATVGRRHQVARDVAVQRQQDAQRQHEEHGDGQSEEQLGPERGRFGQAGRNERTVIVLVVFVLRYHQHRAARTGKQNKTKKLSATVG